MHFICILVVVLTVSLLRASAYNTGAPPTTCWTMYPKHGNYARETTFPYSIAISPDVYTLGENITMTISHPSSQMFTGIQVGAFLATGNTELIVGQFVEYPMDKIRAFTCYGGSMNMVTHWNENPVEEIVLVWQAPSTNMGNITFRSTVVEDFETYWVDIETPLQSSSSNGPIIQPDEYPLIPLTSMVEDIDFGACEDTKGCFMYPRHCDGSNCIAVATYMYRNETDDILMELFTNTGYDYVSLAFSPDDKMGQYDETFTCVATDGMMSVQHGNNPDLFNEKFLTTQISELEIRKQDGNLECRFVVPRTTNRYPAYPAPGTIQSDYESNLFTKMHLQLAWGDAMPDTNVITYHKEMPATSDDTVDIRSTNKVTGSAFWDLVRVHGAVMILAWCLFAGIVTVVARHYKECMPNRTFCNTKAWFQVHRAVAIIVLALTAVGIATVFAEYGTGIREHSKPHAYWGLACVSALGLQIICGILRPGPDKSIRFLFNWGHWFMGHATHILAVVSMFLAFDIEYITDDMRDFGFITLGVWLGVQILWHFIFEVIRWRAKRKAQSADIALEEINASTALKRKDVEEGCQTDAVLLMLIYIVTLSGCTVAVMLAFLLY